MADNNLGSSEELGDLNENFEDFISGLTSDTDSINIVNSARKTAAESLKKQKQALEDLQNVTGNTVKELYSFGKSLSTSSGSAGFESLNKIIGTTAKLMGGIASAIPYVGDALQGVIEGAAEVSKFMIGQFSKAYGNFEKLADTGVISTFDELQQASATMGLTFSDVDKVLSKYSKELSNFNGSALDGRKRLQEIAYETKKVGESFQVIGISASDFADMQMGYIAQQQRSAAGKNLTDKQLAAGTIRYIEELDTLSKLTGISRKELQDQMMERNRNARYLAGIAGLEPETKKNVDRLISQFSALDSEFAEGMQDLIASGGAPITDKAKAAMLALGQGGMNVGEEIQKLKSGGDPREFYSLSTNALKRYGTQITSVVKYVGADNIIGKSYLASQNAQNLTQEQLAKIEEDIIKKRNAEVSATDTEGKKLAETRRSMYNTTKSIDLLATGSKLMAGIMNKMAGGVEDVIGKIYEFLGDDSGIPEYLKLRKQERIAINGNTKLKKELSEKIKRQVEIKEELAKIEKDPNSPENRRKKSEYTSALKTIELEIKVFESQIVEQEESIKNISIRRIEADKAAGFGPPGTSVGAAISQTTGTPPAGGAQPTGTAQTPPTMSQSGTSVVQPSSTNAASLSGSNKGIAAIRELISSVESVGGNYNSLFGGNTNVPLTTMTLAQVLQHQYNMVKAGARSSAAGKYQFMPDSLREYARKLNMDLNSTIFDSTTQDALADILIREKGYDSYKSGKITAEQFLERLSMAWAGLPSPSKGGASYYGKDGLNRSHISMKDALAQIGQARTGGIFSGPSTGYLAMLHGNEAVIPANDGSSALNFTESFGSSDETEIINVFSMITNKIDKMISLNRNQISVQTKFAAYGIK